MPDGNETFNTGVRLYWSYLSTWQDDKKGPVTHLNLDTLGILM